MRDLTLDHGTLSMPTSVPSVLPLETRGLTYVVEGKRLIDSVDLRIEAGAATAVMGFNGAGKSLLLRLMHGLIAPSQGRVLWAAGAAVGDVGRRQAMVFQSPVLLRRSVAANIAYALARHGVRGKPQKQRVAEILERTQLSALRNRAASHLSGGERQRVALARALATEPDVIFLDEPTAALDPGATQAIETILQRAAAAGCKIVLVTQSLGQARRLAHEVVFIHEGRVLEHSPIETFLNSPRSKPAAAFIAGRLI